MYHRANQIPSRRPVSKSCTISNFIPRFFKKIVMISNRFPIQRVDLTAEGLQCLELIFEANKQIDAYVNLTTFINKVISQDAVD